MSFLDVLTDVVTAAGQRTAATSSGWQAWAGRAEEALRAAPGVAHSAVVAAAAGGYVADWNTKLHRVAAEVDALGTNTSSASTAVDNADVDGNGFLHAFGQAAQTEGSHLSRPV
jgi:hypothetical protein